MLWAWQPAAAKPTAQKDASRRRLCVPTMRLLLLRQAHSTKRREPSEALCADDAFVAVAPSPQHTQHKKTRAVGGFVCRFIEHVRRGIRHLNSYPASAQTQGIASLTGRASCFSETCPGELRPAQVLQPLHRMTLPVWQPTRFLRH